MFVQVELLDMVAQLIEQAFAQIAAGYALRIELAHNFQRLVQIGDRKTDIGNPSGSRCCTGSAVGSGCSAGAYAASVRRNIVVNLAIGIFCNI